MKLATWNIARPPPARYCKLKAHMDRVAADVLVLTETDDRFDPGYLFSCSSAPGREGDADIAERWVTICSRFQLQQLPTSDIQRTTAARIHPDGGSPFVVYGTVLPWLGSRWREHPSAGGVAFREALDVQAADWRRLSAEYSDDELFLLGDFNQDLVASAPRYYGSAANRKRLETALADVGLIAITTGNGDPVRRDSAPCACIDHICMRTKSAWHVASTSRWPDASKPPKSLSDHFGIEVTLTRHP